MSATRRPSAALAATIAGAVALGLILAWLLGAFGGEGTVRPRVSAREAVALADGGTPATPPHGRPVSVTVAEHPEAARVAPDFMGLSFESTAIPLLAAYSHGGNLAGYLRSLGHGVIRIGGVSVDKRVAWTPHGARPSWASVGITPTELDGVAALARESGWRVLLTVSLGRDDPRAAAAEVASARSALGGLLAGVAIGNEPDRFAREGLRGSAWSVGEYLDELGAYRAAIARAAPGVSIAVPDASSGIPPLPWVSAAAASRPTLLTDHYYPLSSCGGTKVVLSELASPVLREHEDEMLRRLEVIEHANRTPLAIDETGSISCHGQPGVSNSFASALWAVDWAVRAMHAGVAGLNFHDLVSEPGAYSPLAFTPGAPTAAGGAPLPVSLRPNPDWYALLMTAPLAGSTPVKTSISGDPGLTAAAFLRPGPRGSAGPSARLQLVLVDFDPPSARPLLVRLHLPPAFGGGSILRLMAPSPASSAHVRLGASEVAPSGTWRPRNPLPRLYRGAGAPSLELPASSAALITLDASAAHRAA
jgi:hypothetical protein